MEDQSAPILTQAKREYTSQLVSILTPQIFDGLKSIYDESKIVCSSSYNKQSLLDCFRGFLEKVPEWSQVIIETETDRIIQMSKCDWLDDLITAVFISHTKILTSIGNNSDAQIDLTIPKTINFIHKCYINIAREIWKNPYLYNENVLGSEYQQNMRTVELIIKDSIEDTIRKSLPVKEILRQHLTSYEPNQRESTKPSKSDIKQMLLEELKNIQSMNILQKVNKVETTEPEEDEEEVNVEGDNIEDNVLEPTTQVNDDNEYISPDEDEVEEKCKNLEINTIDNVIDETPQPVVEEVYDNVDIIDQPNDEENEENSELLETFLQNIADNEKETSDINEDIKESPVDENQVKITKIDPDKPTTEKITDITEQELKSTETSNPPNELLIQVNIDTNTNEEPPKKLEEPPKKPEEPPKKPEEPPKKLEEPPKKLEEPPKKLEVNDVKEVQPKEIITVTKHDSDEETVDEFFNDITKIMESKGETINKHPKKYTLFDDAIQEE